MNTIKVAVNKTADRPDGVEIEVVDPENNLEQRVLSYLLSGFVSNAQKQGNMKVDLPEQYTVEYQREGSFVLYAGPQAPNIEGDKPTYYTPQTPKAVLAIHAVGNRFDVVYGEVGKPATPVAETVPAAEAAAESK